MSKVDLNLVIGIHRACKKMDKATANVVGRYKLSIGQFGVLEAIYHKGNLTVGEVQTIILSTVGTIPMIVSNLEKKGLIERIRDTKDRRKCFLTLTEEGKQLIEEVFPKNKKAIEDEMKNLTSEEKKTLLELLKKLSEEERAEKKKITRKYKI